MDDKMNHTTYGNPQSKRIHIDDVKANMVLATDVVTKNGMVLIAADAMLNNMNCSKLRSHGIEYVYVKNASINKNAVPINSQLYTKEIQMIPVTEKQEFIAFENDYKARVEEYEDIVREISDGKNVDMSELYKITDGMIQSLRFHGDVFTFVNYIREVDEYTFSHCINVSILCNIFGKWLGLDKEDLVELTVAGLLHDIGKTKTPDKILNKKSRLTENEFSIMKDHTLEGYRILATQEIPEVIKIAALMHHEKIDGSGYPLGVTGDKIQDIAKIVAICDIYDAMTADRVYRDKLCPFVVIREFETATFGELDAKYMLTFLQNIAYNYLGAWVKLSDEREAEVMFINRNNLSKPLVRTLIGEFIDLVENKEIFIKSLL